MVRVCGDEGRVCREREIECVVMRRGCTMGGR